ncbi:SET domain-containing protein, partial [Cynara cardunculus var. scolymus]
MHGNILMILRFCLENPMLLVGEHLYRYQSIYICRSSNHYIYIYIYVCMDCWLNQKYVMSAAKKDEYLGEYTGELISHEEADIRGKYYDLFINTEEINYNDTLKLKSTLSYAMQLVLDACRAGNKLKFANHSSKPNCYAKITKVGGDHRVAIFAKENLEAGQEIFYDYSYKPEQTPAWAQEPDDEHTRTDSRYLELQ